VTQNTPPKYSERLGSITDEQFQAALDRFNLGKFISAEPISIGLGGQNIFVTSSEGQFVLRGNPHTSNQFCKELFFYSRLHSETEAPVPWPYMHEPSPEIFGWEFVIMPRLPGITVDDPAVAKKLSTTDKLGIASVRGEVIAQMHAFEWDHPGEYDLETNSIKPHEVENYAFWIIHRVYWFLEMAKKASDQTTVSDVKWINEVVNANREAWNEDFVPAVVHHDYSIGNCTVDKVDGKWQVTGIFDLEEAYIGHPEEDLVRSIIQYAMMSDPGSAREFAQGYVSVHPLSSGYRERYKINVMSDALGLWLYGQQNGIWFPKGLCFRKYAEQFVILDLW